MVGLLLIVTLMIVFDLAAIRWGVDSRSTDVDRFVSKDTTGCDHTQRRAEFLHTTHLNR